MEMPNKHKERIFCPHLKCTAYFFSDEGYERHLQEHEEEEVQQFTCGLCDVIFMYRDDLESHYIGFQHRVRVAEVLRIFIMHKGT